MTKSRRQFLESASIALAAAGASCRKGEVEAPESQPGAPPAFGVAPAVGPPVTTSTFAEAEKLVQVSLSAPERQTAALNWRQMMAPIYERRTGPRRLSLDPSLAPASRWDPALPGLKPGPDHDRFIRTKAEPAAPPQDDRELAFATVTKLSRWIESRKLTSERLTRVYLDRLERFDPKLRCVITLTRDLAMAQARQADREIAPGRYRGPLHGIPWGAKDLVDSAGIPDHVRSRAVQESRAHARRRGRGTAP